MNKPRHVYHHMIIRRSHKLWGVLFIAWWCAVKGIGDAALLYRQGSWVSDAICAYFQADLSLLIGIRLFLGVPFFRFRELRDFYHWCRRKSDAI
jgi:hypothetical protein